MRIHLLTVGKIKDPALAGKVQEYIRRIRFDAAIEHLTVKDAGRKSEGERLLQTLERFKRARVYVLSEEGRAFSSQAFADELGAVESDLVFVVGGPEGLSEKVKERADVLLSLSQMTFPHELATVLLSEQIFRALTLLGGRKYHK